MKTFRIVVGCVLMGGSGLALQIAFAQPQGVTRTELQRHDLGSPGREMIQVRVDVEPGMTFPLHSHPGEEVIYVLEGTWEYEIEGKGKVTLNAGEVLFIPAGVNHGAKIIGSTRGSELATYIVEKGRPLLVFAKTP